MTKAARMGMPTVTAVPIWVRKATPASSSDLNAPARITPAEDDQAGVLDGQVGGGPRVVALGRLPQAGDHQDVVVGADGDHEQVDQDRQQEQHPRLTPSPGR